MCCGWPSHRNRRLCFGSLCNGYVIGCNGYNIGCGAQRLAEGPAVSQAQRCEGRRDYQRHQGRRAYAGVQVSILHRHTAAPVGPNQTGDQWPTALERQSVLTDRPTSPIIAQPVALPRTSSRTVATTNRLRTARTAAAAFRASACVAWQTSVYKIVVGDIIELTVRESLRDLNPIPFSARRSP
jgi:hypothetical protein